MKRGMECEGIHYGQDSLFMDACEFKQHASELTQVPYSVAFYISDLYGELDWQDVINATRGRIVTMEVPCLYLRFMSKDVMLPEKFRIMWNITHEFKRDETMFLFDQFDALRPEDQVKISCGQHVICTTVGNFVRTKPEDFAGDRVIDLKQEFNI